MALRKRMSSLSFIFLIFICGVIVFTYPSIFLLKTYVIGDMGDAYLNIWNFWYIKSKLLTEDADIYHTNFQFYPIGTNLSFHTFSLINIFVFLPFQLVCEVPCSYNLTILFSIVLAGLGMYLLVKYLTHNKFIAIICGFAYAFSPYQFAHLLGTFHMNMIQWVPLYVLSLLAFFESKKFSYLLLSSIFLAFNILSDYQIGIYLILFTFFFWCYQSLERKEVKKTSINILAVFLLTFVLVFPIIMEPMRVYLKDEYMKTNITEINSSVALINYFLPNPLNSFFGEKFKKYLNLSLERSLTESVVSIPFVVVLLSVIGCTFSKERKLLFWALVFFIFLILSLGPKIQILPGKIIGESPIYVFFYNCFPFFKGIREPGRFSIMVLFSIVVIFSYSLKYISRVFNKYEKILYFLIFVVLSFENLSIPITMSRADIPNALIEIKNCNNCSVLDYPEIKNPMALYFQTFHQQKILGGYVSRIPPQSLTFLYNIKNNLEEKNYNFVINQSRNLNLRYIIIYSYGYGHMFSIIEDIQTMIRILNAEKIYEDERVSIWKIE